ncbi:PAN domain-containing protein [Nitrosomonas sp.]|uniref:PAN domain-containing protein n=1 Tax=Nitrosomonas sp. TaxID=42353 RepID=UPI002635E665|nr:PAN domain-containing protein [Nitrosomonas sp.]MCW5600037.1 hypothetical protein [Nitrosomonas sp.]
MNMLINIAFTVLVLVVFINKGLNEVYARVNCDITPNAPICNPKDPCDKEPTLHECNTNPQGIPKPNPINGLEQGVDRWGGDYRRIELTLSDPMVCQAECVLDSSCKAFSYVKPKYQVKNPVCYLKNTVPEPAKNFCCVSGLRSAQAIGKDMETDVDRLGMDYRSIQLPNPDPVLCQAECTRDISCKTFTYVKPGIKGPNAMCYLKNGVPMRSSNSCCISGFPLSEYPQLLRVAVFNMNNPGLRNLPIDERMDTLRRWGSRIFANADIVILSELGTPSSNFWHWWDESYLKTLSESSGLFYRYAAFTLDPTWPEMGILSRYPFDSKDAYDIPEGRRIVDVTTRIHGKPIRILGAHFTPSGDAWSPTSPKIESVRKVQDLIANENGLLLFGGDLNTCPPSVAPDGCWGQGAVGHEYDLLTKESGFIDSCKEMLECNNWRREFLFIDYLFFRGGFRVKNIEFTTPADLASPSDHPSFIVTLELL